MRHSRERRGVSQTQFTPSPRHAWREPPTCGRFDSLPSNRAQFKHKQLTILTAKIPLQTVLALDPTINGEK